jgi:hypothetical protein
MDKTARRNWKRFIELCEKMNSLKSSFATATILWNGNSVIIPLKLKLSVHRQNQISSLKKQKTVVSQKLFVQSSP